MEYVIFYTGDKYKRVSYKNIEELKKHSNMLEGMTSIVEIAKEYVEERTLVVKKVPVRKNISEPTVAKKKPSGSKTNMSEISKQFQEENLL